MARERHFEPTSAFLPDLINGWVQVLTRPGQNEYLVQHARSNPLTSFLGVSTFGLLVSLYAATDGSPPFYAAQGSTPAVFLITFFLAAAGFYLSNFLLYLVLKISGGSGNYTSQSNLLSLVLVPFGSILLLVFFTGRVFGLEWGDAFNPLSLSGLVGALVFLLAAYALYQVVQCLKIVHQVRAVSAVYALLALAGAGALLRAALMFVNQEDTLITRLWTFFVQQWNSGIMLRAILGHFWLVLFSIVVAVLVGIVFGVLITLPAHRPRAANLVLLIPFVLFFILWAATSGWFGPDAAAQIDSTTRSWERILRNTGGFFGELLVILGAVVRKPAAIGMIGMGWTAIFYLLYLFGDRASALTLYIAGIILTIPSIALFGVLIPPLGVGAFNAAFALILYAQLPILRNTYTGIMEVEPEIVEAGRGMGMTELQLLLRVKLPLAAPVIMTGIRVSCVMLVGIAAIAAYIGAFTLGEYIFTGISRAQEVRYITGALIVAVFALAVDYLLGWVQERVTPLALKERHKKQKDTELFSE